jgi:hypothetical protein
MNYNDLYNNNDCKGSKQTDKQEKNKKVKGKVLRPPEALYICSSRPYNEPATDLRPIPHRIAKHEHATLLWIKNIDIQYVRIPH